jgi:hypothetical protein
MGSAKSLFYLKQFTSLIVFRVIVWFLFKHNFSSTATDEKMELAAVSLFDRCSVEMPGRMTENGQDDDQRDKAGKTSNDQRSGNNQSP